MLPKRVDMVLVVAEPSLSGISDMEESSTLLKNFKQNCRLCNKYDTNLEETAKIEAICRERQIPYAGKFLLARQ